MKEGTKEGRRLRESSAFRVKNSRLWAGLQGGRVSTGEGYWLKYDSALFHPENVMHRLDTHTRAPTRTYTHRASTKKVHDDNGTS